MANISYRLRGETIYVTFYVSDSFRPEFATGEKVPEKYWDSKKQKVKSTSRSASVINQHLSQIQDDLIQLWRDNKSADHDTLKALAKKAIKGEVSTVQKKTIYSAFDKFLSQYSADKDKKTVAKYRTLRSYLFDFNPNLDFPDLDFNFYDGFKKFLYAVPNPNYVGCTLKLNPDGACYDIVADRRGDPVGLFDDTVFKYLVNLKAFLSWAEKRGCDVHHSYKSWEIIKRTYPPISLTMAELERLESLVITPDTIRQSLEFKKGTKGNQPEIMAPFLNLSRDYLVLECRTGQRISDLKRFDPKDLADFKWTLSPKKGNRISSKKVTVHFVGYCAPAFWIFQKNNFKLPSISESNLNKNIKVVCKMAGITDELNTYRWAQNKRVRIHGPKNEFISSHTGRKTFITLALQSMPPRLVKQLAGIDSYETLKHYEGEAETSSIEKYLNEMQDKTLMKKII
jgi:integrase